MKPKRKPSRRRCCVCRQWKPHREITASETQTRCKACATILLATRRHSPKMCSHLKLRAALIKVKGDATKLVWPWIVSDNLRAKLKAQYKKRGIHAPDAEVIPLGRPPKTGTRW